MSRRQMVYRLLMILITLGVSILIAIWFKGYHESYHSMGIVVMIVLVLSLVIGKQGLNLLAYGLFMIYMLIFILTEYLFSGHLSLMGNAMLLCFTLGVLLLNLDRLEYKRLTEGEGSSE